jgi:hypothetical protein
VKDSPMALSDVGAINRLPPAPETVAHSHEAKYTPKIQFLSSLLKIHSLILFLREDLSSLECATFKQEHLILYLDNLIALVTLGD